MMTAVASGQVRMLRSVKSLLGSDIEALDGEFGKCKDFLFDDERWAIRYLVADTGSWLIGQKLVLSPFVLREPSMGIFKDYIPVDLRKEQIEGAPRLDDRAPISRQYERELAKYYGHPFYWSGGAVWGMGAYPVVEAPMAVPMSDNDLVDEAEIEGTHLRSATEVRNYAISAADGEIGHLEDYVIEIPSWTIRYLVVDTKNWLPGRKVLILPRWISKIDWHERTVGVQMARKTIEEAPAFDPKVPVNKDYEGHFFDYYGIPRDW